MSKSFICLVGAFVLLSCMPLSAQRQAARSGYQFKEVSDIPVTSVKNQANSGTCWCFATLSFLEAELLRQGKTEYDLSEMYAVRNAYYEKGMRYFRFQGKTNFSEGGQAHDVISLIAKYGMMPEQAYTGLQYGKNFHDHSELLPAVKGFIDAINQIKLPTTVWPKAMMSIIETYFGEAPEKFTYEGKEYTPQTFARELGINPDDYVEITSYQVYPFYQQVELEIPDNWMHARYYNVPLEDLMAIMNHSLKNGYTVVWDGDVSENGFSHYNGLAILPTAEPKEMSSSDRARFEQLPETEKMNLYSFVAPVPEVQVCDSLRQATFDDRQSTDDHLMHLTGLVEDQYGTLYYKTKNSWGTSRNPLEGYLYMSEPFVRMKTVAILVNKKALPSTIAKKLGIR